MTGDERGDLRPARPLRRRLPAPAPDDGAATRVEHRLEELVELLHATIDHLVAIEARLDVLEAPARTAKTSPARKSASKAPAKKAAPRKPAKGSAG